MQTDTGGEAIELSCRLPSPGAPEGGARHDSDTSGVPARACECSRLDPTAEGMLTQDQVDVVLSLDPPLQFSGVGGS